MKKLLVALLMVPAMAHAAFYTGNELLTKLNGDSMDRLHALGYIQGAADAYSGIIFCPPGTVTGGQLMDMIKNYLTNTPAVRHRAADVIIMEALQPVWPCKNRNSRGGA
jgi:hypothetical protein